MSGHAPTRLDDPSARILLDKLSAWIATEAWDYLEYFEASNWQRFASPIETAFVMGWQANGLLCKMIGSRVPDEPVPQHNATAMGAKYRLDFAFVEQGIKIAVELDGHGFHERTPAQVESRNKRDADLQMAGWTVLHFSGSEMLRSPQECVTRVADVVNQAHVDRMAEDR